MCIEFSLMVGLVVLAFHHEFGSFFLGCRDAPVLQWLSDSLCCFQILMSVCCPLRAPREHVQTQKVPSHVSSVNLVLESPRMDNIVMVRLLAVFVLECAFVMFVYSSTGVCSFPFYSNMPDLASLIPNKVAVEGECASCVENVSQLAQVVRKQHQVWQLWPQSSTIWAQNPKILLLDITS